MAECPTFLRLPARPAKPRSRGLTHVLDSGLTPAGTRGFLGQAGHLVDIVKVGWGIGYVNPTLEERVRICADHDCPVSLGGTLLEVAAGQDRVGELRDWALKVGMTHIEVSNGLRALPAWRKQALVSELAADFVVLAETGAKTGNYPPTPAEWAAEMAADLDAGASWVIAEGRESGTVGLYHADQGDPRRPGLGHPGSDPPGQGDLRGAGQEPAGLVHPAPRHGREHRQRRAVRCALAGDPAARAARRHGASGPRVPAGPWVAGPWVSRRPGLRWRA